jgi:hypothetical protein
MCVHSQWVRGNLGILGRVYYEPDGARYRKEGIEWIEDVPVRSADPGKGSIVAGGRQCEDPDASDDYCAVVGQFRQEWPMRDPYPDNDQRWKDSGHKKMGGEAQG